jgi:hypothetical protein
MIEYIVAQNDETGRHELMIASTLISDNWSVAIPLSHFSHYSQHQLPNELLWMSYATREHTALDDEKFISTMSEIAKLTHILASITSSTDPLMVPESTRAEAVPIIGVKLAAMMASLPIRNFIGTHGRLMGQYFVIGLTGVLLLPIFFVLHEVVISSGTGGVVEDAERCCRDVHHAVLSSMPSGTRYAHAADPMVASIVKEAAPQQTNWLRENMTFSQLDLIELCQYDLIEGCLLLLSKIDAPAPPRVITAREVSRELEVLFRARVNKAFSTYIGKPA